MLLNSKSVALFLISSDFLGHPLSTFLPVEWGGQAFAYCAEKGFCFRSWKCCVIFCFILLSLQTSFSPTWLKLKRRVGWPDLLWLVSQIGEKQVEIVQSIYWICPSFVHHIWFFSRSKLQRRIYNYTGLPGWEWQNGDLVTRKRAELFPGHQIPRFKVLILKNWREYIFPQDCLAGNGKVGTLWPDWRANLNPTQDLFLNVVSIWGVKCFWYSL